MEDTVELLAGTAILGLSVGCGLAASRAALVGLFSLIMRHSAFHQASPALLTIELPYDSQV